MAGSFDYLFRKSCDLYSNNVTDDNTIFNSFRSEHGLFGFIHNGDSPQEDSAIAISKSINADLYERYFINQFINKKILGYEGGFPSNNALYNELDSRHIMMSIILFENIPKTEEIGNIVEIGGGFGNWLRINYKIQNFKKWTIIDLPHLGKLQAWFLKNNSVPDNIYEIVSANNYEKIIPQIVIGSHSLSEFSWEIFLEYFYKIIINTKYFFYAYHSYSPSKELIDRKNNLIDTCFDMITTVCSESDMVKNCLFVNKFYKK